MKTRLLILALLCHPLFSNAQEFQGEYIYHFQIDAAPTMEMNYRTITDGKRTKSIVSMMGQEMEVLQGDDGYSYAIMHAQKMVMKSVRSSPMNASSNALFEGTQCAPLSSQNKKKILGYDCVEYHAQCTDQEGNQTEVRIWHTDDLYLPMSQDNANPLGLKDLPEKGAMLEMIMSRNSEGFMSIKVSEIVPRVVANEEFELPKGYQIIEVH
jgi:hypothetical protein